jgi:superfamily II DNA or RNA helicase
MNITLRPYQNIAIENALKALKSFGNTLGVAATGAGKTTVFCCIAGNENYKKVLVLQHTIELLRQNKQRFESMFLDKFLQTSEYSADMKNISNYTFGSVATIARLTDGGREKSLNEDFNFDLVVIDECHHTESKSYQNIYKCLKRINPNIHILGVTATAMRGDKKILGLFDNVSFEINIKDLIAEGFLVNPKVYAINVGLLKDMENKNVSVADLDKDSFKDLLNTKVANEEMIKHWKKYSYARQTIIFTGTKQHAEELSSEFSFAKFNVAVVHDGISKKERANIVRRYKEKEIQILINVFTLTEGFDAPATSCVILAKPMCHAGMYIQMIGRGLRLANNKDDCIVLDFGVSTFFNAESLKYGIEAEIKGTEKRSVKRIVNDFKECPLCNVFNVIRERYCIQCNYDFVTKNGEVAVQKKDEKITLDNIELVKLDDFFTATAFQFLDVRRNGSILVTADENGGAVCLEISPGKMFNIKKYIGVLKRVKSPEYELICVSENKLSVMVELEKSLKGISGKRGCLRGNEYMKLPVSESQYKLLSNPVYKDLYLIPQNMFQAICCIFWGKHRDNIANLIKIEIPKLQS